MAGRNAFETISGRINVYTGYNLSVIIEGMKYSSLWT